MNNHFHSHNIDNIVLIKKSLMSECSTFYDTYCASVICNPRGNIRVFIPLSKKNSCYLRQQVTPYISLKTHTYHTINGAKLYLNVSSFD